MEDLRKLHLKNDQLISDLTEYIKLKASIELISKINERGDGFKTQLDLGRNFLVQANIDDPSKILTNVGLGYFVEFDIKESTTFIDRQIKFYTENIKKIKKDSAQTKAMIKLVLQGLYELQLKNWENVLRC